MFPDSKRQTGLECQVALSNAEQNRDVPRRRYVWGGGGMGVLMRLGLMIRSSGVVSGQGAIQQKGSRSGWKVKAILALVHSYMPLAEHTE